MHRLMQLMKTVMSDSSDADICRGELLRSTSSAAGHGYASSVDTEPAQGNPAGFLGLTGCSTSSSSAREEVRQGIGSASGISTGQLRVDDGDCGASTSSVRWAKSMYTHNAGGSGDGAGGMPVTSDGTAPQDGSGSMYSSVRWEKSVHAHTPATSVGPDFAAALAVVQLAVDAAMDEHASSRNPSATRPPRATGSGARLACAADDSDVKSTNCADTTTAGDNERKDGSVYSSIGAIRWDRSVHVGAPPLEDSLVSTTRAPGAAPGEREHPQPSPAVSAASCHHESVYSSIRWDKSVRVGTIVPDDSSEGRSGAPAQGNEEDPPTLAPSPAASAASGQHASMYSSIRWDKSVRVAAPGEDEDESTQSGTAPESRIDTECVHEADRTEPAMDGINPSSFASVFTNYDIARSVVLQGESFDSTRGGFPSSPLRVVQVASAVVSTAIAPNGPSGETCGGVSAGEPEPTWEFEAVSKRAAAPPPPRSAASTPVLPRNVSFSLTSCASVSDEPSVQLRSPYSRGSSPAATPSFGARRTSGLKRLHDAAAGQRSSSQDDTASIASASASVANLSNLSLPVGARDTGDSVPLPQQRGLLKGWKSPRAGTPRHVERTASNVSSASASSLKSWKSARSARSAAASPRAISSEPCESPPSFSKITREVSDLLEKLQGS
eukprot:TRINITY_DN10598_c0_g1_i3.p1 TRINITY_DN10598_c0_g1~~TRINITY_DN10598_c0_g1_i3.p1  ORF type:complete len:667 (+),score=80.56 TRINITY_DN10598_c0_g1_i3:373-2373(+)